MATYIDEKPEVRYDDKASDSQVDIDRMGDGTPFDPEAMGVNMKKVLRKV